MSGLSRWMILAPLALGLLLAGCSGKGSSGSGTPVVKMGRLAGVVTLSDVVNNVPTVKSAPGVDVHVFGTTLHATTLSDGSYTLDNVPVGSYVLVFTLSGRGSEQENVTVLADQTVTVSKVVLQAVARKWTVLVYMDGDNDLEPYTEQDLNEMEMAPDSDKVTIVAQVDRSPYYGATWSGCRRYEIKHDDNPTTSGVNDIDKEDMGNVDMGSPTTLNNFIQWGRNVYPAEHYIVVLWDHGSGWRSRTQATNPMRGIAFDDTSQTYIKTVDLPAALTSVPPLDIVCYDACLMQMGEIAYEIRNNCSYTVGSEEDVPGDGYYYAAWLNPLVANPAMSPLELSETIARETLNYYGTSNDYTQSVIDTTQLPGFVSALDNFAGALLANGSNQSAAIVAARTSVDFFPDTDSSYNYRDLYQYAEKVKAANVASVTAAATALQAAIDRAVVVHYEGTQHAGTHGLSIYLPDPYNYGRYLQPYGALDLALNTRWPTWLAKQPTQ